MIVALVYNRRDALQKHDCLKSNGYKVFKTYHELHLLSYLADDDDDDNDDEGNFKNRLELLSKDR